MFGYICSYFIGILYMYIYINVYVYMYTYIYTHTIYMLSLSHHNSVILGDLAIVICHFQFLVHPDKTKQNNKGSIIPFKPH